MWRGGQEGRAGRRGAEGKPVGLASEGSLHQLPPASWRTPRSRGIRLGLSSSWAQLTCGLQAAGGRAAGVWRGNGQVSRLFVDSESRVQSSPVESMLILFPRGAKIFVKGYEHLSLLGPQQSPHPRPQPPTCQAPGFTHALPSTWNPNSS